MHVPENGDVVLIGSDHGGYELKEFLKEELHKRGIPVEDVGAHGTDPQDDYPDFISAVAKKISNGTHGRGIGICGTGIGASIAANRYPRVRAALCTSTKMARLSREHNNSNVLILGGRITTKKDAAAMLDTWLTTEFQGGRHARRVDKLDNLSC